MPVRLGSPTSMARRNNTFTDRERDVVRQLLTGMSGQQIAAELGVRFYTVTTHIKHIYKKLGIHRRAELFTMALTHDWLATALRGNPQARTRNAANKKAK